MSDDHFPREIKVTIASDSDLLSVRQSVRTLALDLGFSLTETVGIVTALSEMARNMLTYAGRGELEVRYLREADHEGIVITARDEGPGDPRCPEGAPGRLQHLGRAGHGPAGASSGSWIISRYPRSCRKEPW